MRATTTSRQVRRVLAALATLSFGGGLAVATSGSAAAATKPLKLGRAADLTYGGVPFKLTVQQVIDPAALQPGLTPPPGMRDVALKITVKDVGKRVINFDLNSVMAVLTAGNAQYEPDSDLLSGCAGFYAGSIVNIGPNATTSGCIAVGVPAHARLARVLAVGSSSVLASWKVSSSRASATSKAPAAVTQMRAVVARIDDLLAHYEHTTKWQEELASALQQEARLAKQLV